LFNQVQLGLRRRYATLGFLLKGVQHVNDFGEADGIHGATPPNFQREPAQIVPAAADPAHGFGQNVAADPARHLLAAYMPVQA
jgi:hypothetical protein